MRVPHPNAALFCGVRAGLSAHNLLINKYVIHKSLFLKDLAKHPPLSL
jgi:hypothetical protein